MLLDQHRLKDVPWFSWVAGVAAGLSAAWYQRGKKWGYLERKLRLGFLTLVLAAAFAIIALGWVLVAEWIKGS